MNVAKQKGFTAVELIIVVGAGTALIAVIATVWVIVHFVAKFW